MRSLVALPLVLLGALAGPATLLHAQGRCGSAMSANFYHFAQKLLKE